MLSDIAKPFNPKPRADCFCGSGKAFKSCCGRKAPNRKPPHGVLVLPGWLPANDCDLVVDYASLQRPKHLGTVGGFSAADESKLQADPGRITQTVDMGPFVSRLNEWLRAALLEVAEPQFRIRLDYFESAQLLRYERGGWYKWHADAYNREPLTDTWHRFTDRDISVILYLNDGFTGGNLSFYYFNYSLRPRKGDLVLFPSDYRYVHQAEAVLSGTRYAVVTWATAAGGNRILPAPPPNAVFMNAPAGPA